jgi:hypothetical protein
MGGKPICNTRMAHDKLAEVAAQVMEGVERPADAGIIMPVVIVLIIQNLFWTSSYRVSCNL